MLGIVVATFVATGIFDAGIPSIVGVAHEGAFVRYLVRVAMSSLTAPFSAHVLSVLYYRITAPQEPVIHPDVRRWRSVWEGA